MFRPLTGCDGSRSRLLRRRLLLQEDVARSLWSRIDSLLCSLNVEFGSSRSITFPRKYARRVRIPRSPLLSRSAGDSRRYFGSSQCQCLRRTSSSLRGDSKYQHDGIAPSLSYHGERGWERGCYGYDPTPPYDALPLAVPRPAWSSS